MNGDPTNLYARCRVDRVTIELGGAIVLCLEPVGQAKSDQFVFDRSLMLRVPQIADKATKDAAAEFVGRYFDVRITLVGDMANGPNAKNGPPLPGPTGGDRCQIEMMNAGQAYPRSCPTCGVFGKCAKGLERKPV